ncbi:T9SS type A sorting domain-containing protein [Cloacibacterium sp.]|uniref:T9SS type A sorting domain-containing protein n=1 Tax=Cloacibacterium sp. TaxID=1913682 RepID=UPI0039E5D209
MKKILFFALGLCILLSKAQTLVSGDMNDLTNGDVGSNFVFGTPGQDNFYLSGGTASDYQIVEIDVAHKKSLQIKSGLDGPSTSVRQVSQANLSWNTRTYGNNIIRGKVDIYTGSPSSISTEDQFRSNITGFMAGTSTTGILAGIYYNYKDGKIYGHATMKNGTNYSLNHFALGSTIYPQNTWFTVSYYYNADTGQVNWVTPEGNFFTNISTTVVPSSYPTLFNMVYMPSANTQLTTEYISAFDNYLVEATNSTALSVDKPLNEKDITLKIFPNPVSDFVNIKSKSKINTVQIFDISGKLILNSNLSKIDIQTLKKGIYIVKVNTETGIFSEKIIKE